MALVLQMTRRISTSSSRNGTNSLHGSPTAAGISDVVIESGGQRRSGDRGADVPHSEYRKCERGFPPLMFALPARVAVSEHSDDGEHDQENHGEPGHRDG